MATSTESEGDSSIGKRDSTCGPNGVSRRSSPIGERGLAERPLSGSRSLFSTALGGLICEKATVSRLLAAREETFPRFWFPPNTKKGTERSEPEDSRNPTTRERKTKGQKSERHIRASRCKDRLLIVGTPSWLILTCWLEDSAPRLVEYLLARWLCRGRFWTNISEGNNSSSFPEGNEKKPRFGAGLTLFCTADQRDLASPLYVRMYYSVVVCWLFLQGGRGENKLKTKAFAGRTQNTYEDTIRLA